MTAKVNFAQRQFYVPFLVWLGALLIAFLFWRVLPGDIRANENSDYLTVHEPVALNLLNGRGLLDQAGELALRYPPGYPFLLAACFKSADTLRISRASATTTLTLVTFALGTLWLFLLARSVWGTTAALLVAAVWVTYLPALWLIKQPNTEPPFLALFYGGLYLCWRVTQQAQRRGWHFFLAGFLIGAAALIRPIGLLSAVVVGGVWWWASRQCPTRMRLGFLALLWLGNLVAIAPWQIWMYRQTGQFILLSTGLGPGMRDGLRFGTNRKGYRQEFNLPADVLTLMQRFDARAEEMAMPGKIAAIVLEESRPQPFALVKLAALKTVRSWYATDSGRWESTLLLLQSLYLGAALFGGWRAWQYNAEARLLAITIGLLVLYFWGMTVLVLSILRYMIPAMGLVFTLVPGCWVGLREQKPEPCGKLL